MTLGSRTVSFQVRSPSPLLTTSPWESRTTTFPLARDHMFLPRQKNIAMLGIWESPMVVRVDTRSSTSAAWTTWSQIDATSSAWRGAAGCMMTKLLAPARTTQEPGV